MKKLLFLGACLVALASQPVRAQAGGADIVVVRVTDQSGLGKLVIVRPGDKTEELNLNSGSNSSSMKEAGITIQHVLAKLYQEGYALKSTFSGSDGYGATLIFVKEK